MSELMKAAVDDTLEHINSIFDRMHQGDIQG